MQQKSGVYLVDKPTGMTSNDLIQKIKNKFNYKKVGHAGTLDPLATGLMVVLINQATKISNFVLTNDKSYLVTIQLFQQTDTFDITGNIVAEVPSKRMSKTAIKEAVKQFNGYMYEQYPPMYSAVKVNGKKLYEYARKNQEVEITPRTVTIKKCEFIEYDCKNKTIVLAIECSKGTYIRSFVNEFTEALDTIGTVAELRRTASGKFTLEDAQLIENIEEDKLISIYDALMKNQFPLVLYHHDRDIKQGKPIEIVTNNANETIFIVNNEHDVLAIYKRAAKGLYTCARGLWETEDQSGMTEAEKEEL